MRLAADEELTTETFPDGEQHKSTLNNIPHSAFFLQPEMKRFNARPTRPGRENEQKHIGP